LITYQFMHAGWLHLICNAIAIFTFGSELEYILGARRYLTLMVCSGIVGGVFQMAAALAWPTLFGGAVVGASAGAFGLVTAFAVMFPHQELVFLLFFVIPMRLRAKTLLIVSLVIALVGFVFQLGNIAHAAHLGGMAMGWFYIRKIIKNPALLGVTGEDSDSTPKPARRAEKPADEPDEDTVNAVLDKITAHGINSLTSRERAILQADAARKQTAQR
jgi:membrane associated rhomboid family serine protease